MGLDLGSNYDRLSVLAAKSEYHVTGLQHLQVSQIWKCSIKFLGSILLRKLYLHILGTVIVLSHLPAE